MLVSRELVLTLPPKRIFIMSLYHAATIVKFDIIIREIESRNDAREREIIARSSRF